MPTSLHRTTRTADDLDHLTGGVWRPWSTPSTATSRYVARIESTFDFDAGLLVHAWLRDLGNVGGAFRLNIGSPTSSGATAACPDLAPAGAERRSVTALSITEPGRG